MREFDSYCSMLATFETAPDQDLANEFVQTGIIRMLSLQLELGWKLFKALLSYEGDVRSATGSPRDIVKAAWSYYDFLDEDIWLSMLRGRNTTAHIYDAELAKELAQRIIDTYIPAFVALKDGVEERYGADFLSKLP